MQSLQRLLKVARAIMVIERGECDCPYIHHYIEYRATLITLNIVTVLCTTLQPAHYHPESLQSDFSFNYIPLHSIWTMRPCKTPPAMVMKMTPQERSELFFTKFVQEL